MTRARGKMWKRVGTARRFAWAGTDARHPVAGGGVQKKRCSAGRAADRAKRERTAPPPGQAAKKAALSLPSGGTNGCRKSGVRLAKKEVRPGGGGEKDKRERRRCAQRRRWKTPQKAASDETIGKHRLGGPAKACLGRVLQRASLRRPRAASAVRPAGYRRKRCSAGRAADRAKRERAPSVACAAGKEGQKGTAALRAVPPLENPVGSRLGRAQREASSRWPCKTPQKAASDEPIGKHRLGGPAKARKKPPRTSPSGSIASATLQKPVEGRLRRALRRASPRRPCAVSLAGRLGKGRSMTRARGKMRKREGTARRFA